MGKQDVLKDVQDITCQKFNSNEITIIAGRVRVAPRNGSE